MGVVHKLKSEVIDFILQTKKNQPRISVRKLAEMTGQTFQTRISKSSINNVLKEFALSSPVGRPSRKKKDKIFSIPQDAKARIRQEIKKVGLTPIECSAIDGRIDNNFDGDVSDRDQGGDSVSPSGLESEGIAEASGAEILTKEDPGTSALTETAYVKQEEHLPLGEEPVSMQQHFSRSLDVDSLIPDAELLEPPETVDAKELENVRDEPGLSLRPDPLADGAASKIVDHDNGELRPEEVFPKRLDRSARMVDPVLDQPVAGAVILYAVAQALTHKSFFVKLLADEKLSPDQIAFEKFCQAEIFYQWLGKICGVVPEVVDKSPIGLVLGYADSLERKVFQGKIAELQVDDFFRIRYLTERDQLDIAVSGYRVALREGGAFSVDALNQALTLYPGKSFCGRPLNLAVCDLSSQIISNLRPLLIHHLGVQENAMTALRHLCLAFCFSEKSPFMKRVSLLNFQGDEMAVFDVVSTIPRTFLIGLPLADPVFGRNREFLSGEIINKADMVVAGQSYLCTIRDFAGCQIFSEGGQNTAVFDREDSNILKIIEIEDCRAQKSWFLTNSENKVIPDLLESYAWRWQSLTGKLDDFVPRPLHNKVEQEEALGAELRDMKDIFVNFGQYLADKILDWLFPDKESLDEQRAILREICLLPGQVEEQNRRINLCLNIRKLDPEIKEKILIIFTRFNQYEFMDYKGRRFYIKPY